MGHPLMVGGAEDTDQEQLQIFRLRSPWRPSLKMTILFVAQDCEWF
jgi:hypothetical protein